MTDRELQEQWLKNNKPKVVETVDYSIDRDFLKRSKKSSIENNEYRALVVQQDGKMVKAKKYLDEGAISTLSSYCLKEEEDKLIGRYLRCIRNECHSSVRIMRKIGNKYYCEDGKVRTKSTILKQLV